MIVQLIGTKYVEICEAVWAESRAHNTTRIRADIRTDHRRTDMNNMSPFGAFAPQGTIMVYIIVHMYRLFDMQFGISV